MNGQLPEVEFAGENPCVVLYDDRRNVLAAVSYWRADSSLYGVGQVLFLLRASQGLALEASVFSDNAELAGFLSTINQHFEGFQGTRLAVPVRAAELRVHRSADAVELDCASDKHAVRVSWKGLGRPRIVRSTLTDFGNRAGLCYEVSTVIIPAASGSIVIDGERQQGHVVDGYGALPRSAFLAFCETWTRIAPEPQ